MPRRRRGDPRSADERRPGRHRRPHPREFRRTQNWIGGSSPTNARFVPPPVEQMHTALHEWEEWGTHDLQPVALDGIQQPLRRRSGHEVAGSAYPLWEESLHVQDDLPPLVKIGLLHAQFETIHPFIDGNGGVGRLSITFLLTKWGVLQQPLLYLSGFLRRHIDEHDRRRQLIRDDGDWGGWLVFFLEGVTDTAAEATTTLRAILDLRERGRQRIADLGQRASNAYRRRRPSSSLPHARLPPGCLCSGPEGFRSASANRSGRTAAPAAAWREDGCRAPRSRTHPLSRHRPAPSAGTRAPPTPATSARSRPR